MSSAPHRPLSFDERQAFERAYQFKPPSPHWGARARLIYEKTLEVRKLPPDYFTASQPDPDAASIRYRLWHVIVADPLHSCSLLFPERMSAIQVRNAIRQLFPNRSFSYHPGALMIPIFSDSASPQSGPSAG